MNARPADDGRVKLADVAYVLVALQAIVMVVAALCIAVAFCAVLLADLMLRAQVLELRALAFFTKLLELAP